MTSGRGWVEHDRFERDRRGAAALGRREERMAGQARWSDVP